MYKIGRFFVIMIAVSAVSGVALGQELSFDERVSCQKDIVCAAALNRAKVAEVTLKQARIDGLRVGSYTDQNMGLDAANAADYAKGLAQVLTQSLSSKSG